MCFAKKINHASALEPMERQSAGASGIGSVPGYGGWDQEDLEVIRRFRAGGMCRWGFLKDGCGGKGICMRCWQRDTMGQKKMDRKDAQKEGSKGGGSKKEGSEREEMKGKGTK